MTLPSGIQLEFHANTTAWAGLDITWVVNTGIGVLMVYAIPNVGISRVRIATLKLPRSPSTEQLDAWDNIRRMYMNGQSDRHAITNELFLLWRAAT